MTKLNFAIFGAVMAISLAGQAFAETTIPWTKEGCESVKGKWITAKNGTNFCKSSQYMTWFNALIWCKSIGRNLVDFYHLCPGVPAENNTHYGTCTNVYQLGYNQLAWTNMPYGTDKVFITHLTNADVSAVSRVRTGDTYAVCE